MNNLIDALLQADKEVLTAKTEIYEVKRLSDILGQKFELTLQGFSARRYTEIQTQCIKFDTSGNQTSIKLFDMQLLTLCEGISAPDFNDKALLKQYGVATKKDLFEKILNAGEIAKIYDKINQLCGYDSKANENKVATIKNL